MNDTLLYDAGLDLLNQFLSMWLKENNIDEECKDYKIFLPKALEKSSEILFEFPIYKNEEGVWKCVSWINFNVSKNEPNFIKMDSREVANGEVADIEFDAVRDLVEKFYNIMVLEINSERIKDHSDNYEVERKNARGYLEEYSKLIFQRLNFKEYRDGVVGTLEEKIETILDDLKEDAIEESIEEKVIIEEINEESSVKNVTENTAEISEEKIDFEKEIDSLKEKIDKRMEQKTEKEIMQHSQVQIKDDKKDFKTDDESKKRIAVHKVGHSLIHYLINKKVDVNKIYVKAENEHFECKISLEDSVVRTNKKLLDDIKICLAGMAAEDLYFEEHTDSCSEDLKKASSIAFDMITKYGMSDLGYVYLENPEGEIERMIYVEQAKIIKSCYEKVYKLLKDNKAKCDNILKCLFDNGEIDEERFLKEFQRVSLGLNNIFGK